jgi:uncharacterized protein (TIGR02466 family)
MELGRPQARNDRLLGQYHAAPNGAFLAFAPAGSPGLKFEDPRLERFMAAPPRKSNAGAANRTWVTVPAAAGRLVLFESWLRHEVAANPVGGERVSVSFNYNWF